MCITLPFDQTWHLLRLYLATGICANRQQPGPGLSGSTCWHAKPSGYAGAADHASFPLEAPPTAVHARCGHMSGFSGSWRELRGMRAACNSRQQKPCFPSWHCMQIFREVYMNLYYSPLGIHASPVVQDATTVPQNSILLNTLDQSAWSRGPSACHSAGALCLASTCVLLHGREGDCGSGILVQAYHEQHLLAPAAGMTNLGCFA